MHLGAGGVETRETLLYQVAIKDSRCPQRKAYGSRCAYRVACAKRSRNVVERGNPIHNQTTTTERNLVLVGEQSHH